MKKLIILIVMITGMLASAQNNDNDNVEKRIDAILQQLTVSEKIAMCHAQSKFSTPGVPRLGIPELWMSMVLMVFGEK